MSHGFILLPLASVGLDYDLHVVSFRAKKVSPIQPAISRDRGVAHSPVPQDRGAKTCASKERETFFPDPSVAMTTWTEAHTEWEADWTHHPLATL